MTQQLRLAVIGAGAMGRDHIRYIQDNPDAALVAIADPMHESEELAKSIGVAWYADYNDMFDHVELDGVIIASPNSLHLPMARAALKHGVPPLVEKPISDDLDDARIFAKEAREIGLPVLVGQHRRHNPKVQRAKEIIESGVLGTIVTVSVHYNIYKPDTYYDIPWRRQKGAGPILVNMVHDVDLMRYLIGEPVEIQGMAANSARGFEVEDSAVVNVRFESGTLRLDHAFRRGGQPVELGSDRTREPVLRAVRHRCVFHHGYQGVTVSAEIATLHIPGWCK